LEQHDLFDKLAAIHREFLRIKLEEHSCGRCFNNLTWMNMFSDLPTRLKNVLNPDEPDEVFVFDVIYEDITHLVFRLLENLNFVTKVLIIWATY
jgi:hypothetical protein